MESPGAAVLVIDSGRVALDTTFGLADIANAPGVTKETAQLAGGILRVHFGDGRLEADEIAQAETFSAAFAGNPAMPAGEVKAFIESHPEFEDMAKPARRRMGY